MCGGVWHEVGCGLKKFLPSVLQCENPENEVRVFGGSGGQVSVDLG